MSDEIISYEPATGAILWRHPIGDVDAEVACARAGWSSWASEDRTGGRFEGNDLVGHDAALAPNRV